MKRLTSLITAGGLAGSICLPLFLTGCADMPGSSPDASNQCTFPATAAYAGTGAVLAGGITAIASHGNGLATGLVALAGAAAGAMYGHMVDEQCQHQALQKAMAQAEAYQAQQAAYQQQALQQQAMAETSSSSSVSSHRRHHVHAVTPPPPPPPQFKAVAWQSGSSGHSGAVLPLAPITVDAQTGQNCDMVENDVTKNGQSVPTQMKVCKQPDGTWQPMAS